MTCTLLVLQHADWEQPGRLLTETARALDLRLLVARVFEEDIPDPADCDALVLLGGPANVDEEERYPFLRQEKRLLRAWLAMDRPCLGFCLGHQLLADALGATIAPNPAPSIGWVDGHLTHAGREHPLFTGIDPPLPLFKWHAQAVQPPLPRDMVMLATSNACVVEAFSVRGRPHIMGLQSDNHAAHPQDVRTWMDHDRDWLDSHLDGEARDTLLQGAEERFRERQLFFTRLMDNFVTLIQKTRTGTSRP